MSVGKVPGNLFIFLLRFFSLLCGGCCLSNMLKHNRFGEFIYFMGNFLCVSVISILFICWGRFLESPFYWIEGAVRVNFLESANALGPCKGIIIWRRPLSLLFIMDPMVNKESGGVCVRLAVRGSRKAVSIISLRAVRVAGAAEAETAALVYFRMKFAMMKRCSAISGVVVGITNYGHPRLRAEQETIFPF